MPGWIVIIFGQLGLLGAPALVGPAALAAPPAVAQEAAVHIPKTPDDPAAQAAAKLLGERCTAGEQIAIFPPFGRQSWAGDWGLFSGVCTDTSTGKQRKLSFWAPREAKDRATDFIFEGEGMTRAQLRRILASVGAKVRLAARVVTFALPELQGNVIDGNGPQPGAERPRIEGDALIFMLQDLRRVTVQVQGDGPVVATR